MAGKSRYIVKLTGDDAQTQVLKHALGHVNAKTDAEKWCWFRGVQGAHKFMKKAEAEAAAKLVGGTVCEVAAPVAKGGNGVEDGNDITTK